MTKPNLTEDDIVKLALKHFDPKTFERLTIKRWKDSIDVDYPTSDLIRFVYALAAAAEVGESADDKFWKRELERVELRHRIELAATIERCAQVARDRAAQYDHQNNNQENALWNECMEIADAIRALKDKP